jgi:3-hydroxy-9,10-secoandrosta-1,3,5(10)-triene-9,17-dione monooxygenase reductase component
MSTVNSPTDIPTFRRVLSHYPTGVCAVTAIDTDGSRIGFVVGTFNSVSLDPPLIGFFADKRSSSWARIAKVGKFCVNILSSEQHDICRRLSTRSEDKFKSVSHRLSPNGLPILDDVVGWIECSVEAVHEAGDHYIALGRVISLDADARTKPLVFLQGQLTTVASA